MGIRMLKLYSPKARYVALGLTRVGRDSAWTPGLNGRVFLSRSAEAEMASIAPGFLPGWLEAQVEAGAPLPTHFKVFGPAGGEGRARAEAIFEVN